MHDRSSLLESFVWLLPFLCVQRKRGEKETRKKKEERRRKKKEERRKKKEERRKKKEEEREREIPPNSGLTYRDVSFFYLPNSRLTYRQNRCFMLFLLEIDTFFTPPAW